MLTRVGACAQVAIHVAQFHYMGVAVFLAKRRVTLATRDFGAQPGAFAETDRAVHRRQGGFPAHVTLVNAGQSDLALVARVVAELHGDAAAVSQLGVGLACGLVFGDDEHQVEIGIARGNRLTEEQRSQRVVDLVVEVTRVGPGADDDLGPEAVAHLDTHLVGIHHDVAAGETVQARGPVALDLVLAKALCGLAGEGVVAKALALVLGLETVERAAVAAQLGHRQAGVVVAEHRIELGFFNLQVELARTGRVELRLGGVGIQRVELVRIDRLIQRLIERLAAGGVLFLGAVVGHGQQVLALDLALGIEGHAVLVKQLLVGARGLQAFHIAAQALEAPRSLGKADQHPFAQIGREPGPHFLHALAAEIKVEHHLAGLRRGLQGNQGHAIVADPVTRLASQVARQGLALDGIGLVL